MRKTITILSVALLAVGMVTVAAGLAGSKDDPLVSLSYINGTYLNSLKTKATQKAQTSLDSAQTNIDKNLSAVQGEYVVPQTNSELAQAIGEQMNMTSRELVLQSGDSITCTEGTEVFFTSGNMKISGGKVLNLTRGTEVKEGAELTVNNLYLVPENNTTKFYAVQASKTTVAGTGATANQNTGRTVIYERYADALAELGLFKGTGNGYELQKVSTRIEGLVMLIRLLGEEENALKYTGNHPFTDVPTWADGYVAYAYQKGYTNGSSATTFSPSSQMSGNQYLTFILRALGYSDANGDFVWSDALTKTVELGILTMDDRREINLARLFYRDHIAMTSWRAMYTNLKNTKTPLYQSLISKGAITQASWKEAEMIVQ